MTDREAFEQDYSRRKGPGRFVRYRDGNYVLSETQTAWESWQAALAYRSEQASKEQVPEGYRLVPIEPTVAMLCELNEAAIEVAGMRHGENADIALRRAYAGMLAAAPLPHKEGE